MIIRNKRSDQRAPERAAGKVPLVSGKAGILVAMALELPASILGEVVFGYLLDKYFNTSPLGS